nr:uncharacterized protein LOC115254902 [Aedes albopictus]
MDYKKTLLLCAALISAIDGRLLCYYCEDCALSVATIQPCGFTNPVLITPSAMGGIPEYLQNSQHLPNPILTPPPVVGELVGNTINPPYSEIGQGDPILTPPSIPAAAVTPEWNYDGFDSGANNGELLLTTIWPGMTRWKWWSEIRVDRPAIAERFKCVMTKHLVGNRQVISRGCALQGRSTDETCNRTSKSNYQQCTLCSSSLCNH